MAIDTTQSTTTTIPGMMPYIRAGQRRLDIGDKDSWRYLLAHEDARCIENGFTAGVLSISFGASAGAADGLTASQRLAQVLDTVLDTISFTDRVCVLSPTEVAVMLIPLHEVHDAELRAIEIDELLREDGVDAGIGWAVRRPTGFLGDRALESAAARADANASTAHGRHLRLV